MAEEGKRKIPMVAIIAVILVVLIFCCGPVLAGGIYYAVGMM